MQVPEKCKVRGSFRLENQPTKVTVYVHLEQNNRKHYVCRFVCISRKSKISHIAFHFCIVMTYFMIAKLSTVKVGIHRIQNVSRYLIFRVSPSCCLFKMKAQYFSRILVLDILGTNSRLSRGT
jgi:hypothetical protein